MNLDFEILRALRAAGEGPVSGADLSQRLGVSRAAIWARVRELRSFGYEIEASPHRGYRLLRAPDLLHAADLLARLGATRVVGVISGFLKRPPRPTTWPTVSAGTAPGKAS
jgi:BirA family biotin operon repressor/biotin-[acetyl-CoA-carboxylase] ligase